MKGLGGKRKVNKVLPEHLLVAHSVPWIPDFFTLRTFPTPRVPQGCRCCRSTRRCVPTLQSSQLGRHAQAGAHAPDVVVAEKASTVLVLGSVVHATVTKTLQAALASPLLLILLGEKALLTFPTCLVLVPPERDCFLLLFWTRVPVQLTMLVTSRAAAFVLSAIDKFFYCNKSSRNCS